MKYIRGNQTYKLDDLPLGKVNLVADGDREGIWVKQGEKEVVLQNHALHFYPLQSWGAVLPSTNPVGNLREEIDVTEMRGEGPMDLELILHPEAWDEYLKRGTINEGGEPLDENGQLLFGEKDDQSS